MDSLSITLSLAHAKIASHEPGLRYHKATFFVLLCKSNAGCINLYHTNKL